MLPGGCIGPATGAAGEAMWPLVGLTCADRLPAPAALRSAPGVRPAVPALLGTVMAQPAVLNTELLAPDRVLPACLPALGYAPAAAHLPRSLAVH
jgi:hypothetical protein